MASVNVAMPECGCQPAPGWPSGNCVSIRSRNTNGLMISPMSSALTMRTIGPCEWPRVRSVTRRPTADSDVRIGLRVVQEVAREDRQPEVGERLGHLGVAPAGLARRVPGGIADLPRIGGSLAEHAGQR